MIEYHSNSSPLRPIMLTSRKSSANSNTPHLSDDKNTGAFVTAASFLIKLRPDIGADNE